MKYVKEFIERFSKYPLFTFNDARLVIEDIGGPSGSYTRRFLYLMLKKGRIYRVTKGYYAVKKDLEVVGLAFEPYYYGLGYALTHHGMWEQQANITVITTKAVNEGIRIIFGNNVIFKRIPEKFFFGYESIQMGNYSIHISDLEKTLIDVVYFKNQYADYVFRNISKKVDKKKLRRYLISYDDRVKERVEEIANIR